MGPFRLTGRLGSGGMGQVFLGRSAGGRPVAVKVIRADLAANEEFRTRFRHEVEAARLVNGLYTALLVDADVTGPVPWLATAYVSGPSLADAVTAHGPLPVESVLALAAGLAESLQAIHRAGLVHRDLKPANVLLADDGPRVIDFGISRAMGDSILTLTGAVVGSPGFMSPEQAEGRESGPPSDVFSLGGVLAFAATGQPPFGMGPTPMLLYRVVHGTPNLDEVPDTVRPLIADCLAKDPGARPTTAEILARVGDTHPGVDWLPGPLLAAIAAGQATGAAAAPDTSQAEVQRTPTVGAVVPPADSALPAEPDAGPGSPGAPDRYPRPRGSNRWFLAAAAGLAAVAAVAIVAVLAITHGGQGSPSNPPSSTGAGLPSTQATSKSGTPSTSAHALSWSAPRSIDSTKSITSVSCSSASFCMAVDAAGNAIEWNGSTWLSQGVAGGTGFTSVSCPSAQFCAAVTGNKSYFLWNGASWRGPLATPNSDTFEAIDCVSASFCAAVGGPEGHGAVAATWQGGVWALATGLYIDSMFSVSCAGPEYCLAAGDGTSLPPGLGDETLTWAAGSWGIDQLPVPQTASVTARVSCASQGFCMIVDRAGEAAEWDGTNWLHPSALASGELNWVSCATPSLCAAVSSTGNAVLWNGTTWKNAGNIDRSQAMISVSCPTDKFCVAVDGAGHAVTYS
jgi:serine/threonine protein kinase